jgi:uncharacterized membrane protein YesL
VKFNFDNPVFVGLGKLVDMAWLSLLWLLCCIPVFTIGASTSALCYATHKSVRCGRSYVTRCFFGAFRDNFKQGTIVWMVWLVAFLILFTDALVMRQTTVLFYFFIVMMILAVIWLCYLLPYVARFENTGKATLKNALILEFVHPQWSVLLLAILAAGVFLIWLIPILLIVMPTIVALLSDLILQRIFRRYMSEEDLAAEKENDMYDMLDY